MTYTDVVFCISEFLSNREKIRLSAVSSAMNKLKYQFIYREEVYINKVLYLPYYQNFEFIKILSQTQLNKCHKNVKYISFTACAPPIPVGITHLLNGICFISSEWDIVIPTTVTHLTFPLGFDRKITEHIPSSVTHISFADFNRPIDSIIPQSVTHLSFGNRFNHQIMSLSVTHLTLGRDFDSTIADLPLLVELIIPKSYDLRNARIPTSTKIIKNDGFIATKHY